MPEPRAPFRGFLAVPLPEDVREQAAAVVERLRGAGEVRWTATANFHLTLKFLGEVAPRVLPELTAGLAEAARATGPFDVELGGAGAFPRMDRPQVVWIGLTAGQEALAELAGRVEAACARAGFPRDERPFRAHLTLGRVKSTPGGSPAGELPARLRALGDVTLGAARVEAFDLMQSTLTPRGPIYSIVETFALSAVG
jgi:RNA 2',3'-cyclic 3'-phosphodiesterase